MSRRRRRAAGGNGGQNEQDGEEQLDTAGSRKAPADLFGQKKAAPRPAKIDWSWRPQADRPSATQPQVVCGMPVVPADPKIDPKMRVAAPDQRTTFTLRTIPPTVCRP